MTALDLTQEPPRSGHDRLAGIAFLPRTIDKVRAGLQGGNCGAYRIPGLSERMFNTLGIDAERFAETVCFAKSEEEVGSWVRAQTTEERIAAWNALMPFRIRDAEHRADLTTRYPILADRPDIDSIIDMLDLDDGRLVQVK
jgi:uncharacterized protein DUF5069